MVWADNGVQEDSTLGFADREGFRCGTCFPFAVYDIVHDRPTDTLERPLIFMDVAARGRGLSNAEMLDSLNGLFERCLSVGGDMVVLWHNSNTVRDWTSCFQEVYTPFLRRATTQLRDYERMEYDQQRTL